MVNACKERGVTFFYGISPGLDIGYSNPKDVADLKAKCDDLRSLGCEAFALLWDDIDTTLPKEDRGAFRDSLDYNGDIGAIFMPHLLHCSFEFVVIWG